MDVPTVSIVIPSYNHEKYIKETLDSVLNQSFQDFEIIITDDGSSDNTVKEIKKFSDPRIKLFVFEENKGACTAVNNCIIHSKGKYITVLSSDDVWELDKLEKQTKFLDENPEIAIVFTRAKIMNENGEIFQNKKHFYYSVFDKKNRNNYKWLKRFFLKGNCLCHPSAMIRKRVYDDLGLYNELMGNLPDLDMWVRVCLKYNIHILPEKLTKFRIRDNHANCSTQPHSRIRGRFEYLQIFDHYLKIDNCEFFLKIFPECQKYGPLNSELIPYFLGRIAIDTKVDHKQLWGLKTIYNLMQSSEIVDLLKNNYNFKYSDFLKMTAEVDFFKIKVHPEKDREILEKKQIINNQNKIINKQKKSIVKLNSQIKRMRENTFEKLYFNGVGRSSKQKLISKFPSIYLLFKMEKLNFKNVLINIRNYHSIKKNKFLDVGFYLNNNPDVRLSGQDPIIHYIYHGYKEGRQPNPHFDTADSKYNDVKNSNINPLMLKK